MKTLALQLEEPLLIDQAPGLDVAAAQDIGDLARHQEIVLGDVLSRP